MKAAYDIVYFFVLRSKLADYFTGKNYKNVLKVISGDPVVPLSEPLAADVCVNGDPAADDSIALVPETQLEGDAASTVEVPHTSSEEVIENRTEVSEAPLSPINAVVQQRSYLESVVGTGPTGSGGCPSQRRFWKFSNE
nr:hypothetical protein Iba_chr12aCG11270 [Ipomoea batatas]